MIFLAINQDVDIRYVFNLKHEVGSKSKSRNKIPSKIVVSPPYRREKLTIFNMVLHKAASPSPPPPPPRGKPMIGALLRKAACQRKSIFELFFPSQKDADLLDYKSTLTARSASKIYIKTLKFTKTFHFSTNIGRIEKKLRHCRTKHELEPLSVHFRFNQIYSNSLQTARKKCHMENLYRKYCKKLSFLHQV